MTPFLRYTTLRLLFFIACLIALFTIPWMRDNPFVLIVGAALISAVLSLFFLRGPRDELSARVADRVEHRLEHKEAVRAGRSAQRDGAHELTDEDVEDAEAAASERYR